MSDIGTTVALIKALTPKIDPTVIKEGVTDWLDDHPEATTTVEDGAITKAKLDSNLQGTVDDVDELKSALHDTKEQVYDNNNTLFDLCGEIERQAFTWISNSYVKDTNGAITSYNGWHRTDYIDINGAEKVYLYATATSNTQTYNCWYDANKVFIDNFLCKNSITEYTPPEGAKYFILSTQDENSVQQGVIQRSINKLIENIGFTEDAIEVMNDMTEYESFVDFDWIEDSYVKNTNGQIATYEGWHRTDYIDINGAEKIYLYATQTGSSQDYNCWYDSSKAFISKFLCNSATIEYTPPSGAKYFILSTQDTNNVRQKVTENSIDGVKKNLGIVTNEITPYVFRDNIAASETIDTEIDFATKIGFKAGFYAEFTGSLDSITFQFDAYSPNQIIIDGTNITFKARFASDIVQAHGLTISNNLTVNIIQGEAGKITVVLASNGVMVSFKKTFTITAYETFKVINGTTALSNAIITIGCGTINHDVWVIGDSYMGVTDDNRWAYYLVQNEFTKNVLLCGSTGSGRAESNLWIRSLMEYGCPKILVWAMGMNYASDGSTSPTSGWKAQLDSIIQLCENNNIELVLCTIPTVPTKNHEQKDAYIRSSGYRYIDFAKAVGAQSDGTWNTGMLDNDGIHPTALGAVALYNMAIASLPELTYD